MSYQKPLLNLSVRLFLLFLTSDDTGTLLTTSMAWSQRPTMIYQNFRRHQRRTNYITDRKKNFVNLNLLSSSRLFSSTSQSSSTAQNNNDFENSYRHQLPASQTIIDVTLAGDYLIQMLITSPTNSKNVNNNLVDNMSLYTWSLYRIEDVITASLTATGPEDEEKESIWTNGTRASEALRYMTSSISSSTSSDDDDDHDMSSLSSSSKEIMSQLKPRAEIICLQNDENDYLELGVQLEKHDNDSDNDIDNVDKGFLALLQLLQAQWVVGQQQTEKRQTNGDSSLNNKNNISIKDNDDDYFYNLRISIDSLLSQHRISQLFSSNAVAALLDNNDGFGTTDVEWIEMMTGSSKIVGRLPRYLVHKYNILHRGIGAFVTKDRPIDWSSISSPSSPSSFPDIYVHRRAESKKMFPSLYDMFVGGISLAGEPSEATAQREIAEELGLSKALSTSLSTWSNGKPFLTCLICTGYNRCIVDLFQYVMDTNDESVVWQEEEVVWGDFVNYKVVMASADLSMKRAASAGTWAGPPIQSELKGIMPIKEADINNSKLAVTAYSESWKEWDFVPDGLLVWRSWLEFLETAKKHHHDKEELSWIQGQYSDDDNVGNGSNSASVASNPIVSFEVEVVIEEGQIQIVTVELSSAEEILAQSQQLADQFNADVNDMQLVLQKSWDDITFIPTYNGPVTSKNTNADRAECKVELPSGLVLELRPSTIGEAAGLGIFVTKRSSDNISDGGVLQTQGSAFCGYGICEKVTDSLTDLSEYQLQRSFEFLLSDGLESYVWYEGKLLTVWEVMESSGATGVHAHCLVETKPAAAAEEVEDNFSPGPKLSLIPDPEGKPCYLIPPAERPDPKSLTIQSIGQMCNDLAGGISVKKQTEEEYDTACHRDNLLVLVPRVMIKDDGILQPIGMPILTLAKTVNISNVMESMEVGLRYGREYWANELL